MKARRPFFGTVQGSRRGPGIPTRRDSPVARQLFLFLLILSLGGLWGCGGGGSPTAPQGRALFRGVVHVVQTETPVAGVTVTVQNRTTMTATDGAFSISDLTPGSTNVALRKTGFLPGNLQLTLVEGTNDFSLGIVPEAP